MSHISNSELEWFILPWAKEHHPEKYAATLGVIANPKTYRRYLLRLVEIRCTQEPAWRHDVPISVLDETSLVIKVRDKRTDKVIEFKGARAPGPMQHRIKELALPLEDFRQLNRAIDVLDLEYVTEGT